ncbi:MAG: hypothetical protein IPG62_07285 [Sphingomonadales bacterium]|nr:hypothetical protein [Sphingomonadales bacterium]
MGVVKKLYPFKEATYTWDKFEAVDAEIIRQGQRAQKALTGGGIVCPGSPSSIPMGPAPLFPSLRLPRTETSLEHYQALSDVASDAISGLGATITHHHAGRTQLPSVVRQGSGPAFPGYVGWRKIAVDPDWIMNPGMLLDRLPDHLKIVG